MRLLCLILSTFVSACLSVDPWSDGPYTPGHKSYHGFMNDGLDKELEVYYPDVAGTFPVIYFVGGLGGMMPAIGYTNMMLSIASHGIVVLGLWGPVTNPEENYEAEWMVNTQEWVEENLDARLHNDGVNARMHLDHEKIFLWGHSAGAHIDVEYLKNHCNKVKGQILFSPVDGFDPFGLVEMYAITPGEYLNYETPALVLIAGLDSTPGSDLLGNLMPACAPEELSNERFYNALPGPTWFVNATEYGHGDCLDDFYYNTLLLTHFCDTEKETDKPLYRLFVAGEVVSFVNVVLYEDCEYLRYLEDPLDMPVLATTMKKESVTGKSWACGDPTFCDWQEDPFF